MGYVGYILVKSAPRSKSTDVLQHMLRPVACGDSYANMCALATSFTPTSNISISRYVLVVPTNSNMTSHISPSFPNEFET